MSKEYIICSAIHFDDGKEHVHQPVNIGTGFVITGRRHHNCYTTLSCIGQSLGIDFPKKKLELINRDCQGFLTNLDRFVDRKEGYQIAKAAGQLQDPNSGRNNPILISEDLY